jgi:hypothetical protein
LCLPLNGASGAFGPFTVQKKKHTKQRHTQAATFALAKRVKVKGSNKYLPVPMVQLVFFSSRTLPCTPFYIICLSHDNLDEISSFDTKVRPRVIDRALDLVHQQDVANVMINHIVLTLSAPGVTGAIATSAQEKVPWFLHIGIR